MWENLVPEVEALKASCFENRTAFGRFPGVVDSFLHILAYVLAHQHEGAWEQGRYQVVLGAHTLRLLREMGIKLDDRWNLAESRPTNGNEGNLLRLTRWIVKSHHRPLLEKWSQWADDIWDDAYVLLALDGVLNELEGRGERAALRRDLQSSFNESLKWLSEQARSGFDKVPRRGWFGPAFYAAGVELFSNLSAQGRCPDGGAIIESLARPLGESLQDPAPWESRRAWHVGQVVVMWKRHREAHGAIADLEPLVRDAYAAMLKTQADDGPWGKTTGGRDDIIAIYSTTRALAACYAMEPAPESSEHVRRAHKFLIDVARAMTPPLGDLKACVNAIEAYQDLLRFHLPSPHLHLLIALLDRVYALDLAPLLSPSEADTVAILREIRAAARFSLETRGATACEPLGVNGQLLSNLLHSPDLGQSILAEFNDSQATEKLLSFLSTGITEVRSNVARQLILDLWSRDGHLNFRPFVERLSNLEHTEAFFSRYRDHVNHQVLFFLLGAFLYRHSPPLRTAVDEEIERTYTEVAVPAPGDLLGEFLFRWKLTATFHDVGYLFEVSPETTEPERRAAEKEQLIRTSLQCIEDFRAHYLEGIGAEEARRQLEVYPPIQEVEDLYRLADGDDAFKMVSNHLRLAPDDLVQRYFQMCERESPGPERAPFYDHGIMSALLLLKTADIQRFYLRQLSEQVLKHRLTLSDRLHDKLVDPSTRAHLEPAQFYVRFSHVAGAIALHNVYPRLYSADVCERFGLREAFWGTGSRRFLIRLDDNALAYLAATVDALQDWDRHSFRKPDFDAPGAEPLSAAELTLVPDGGCVVVVPLSTGAGTRLERIYEEMTVTLEHLSRYVKLAES